MISIESVIELAKPWALKIIEEKVVPFVINKGKDLYSRERQLSKIRKQMCEYLSRTKAQCSTINSLSFPNVLKKINDIYEPLSISSLDTVEERVHKITRGSCLFDIYQHILIIDNAGMGKSTLLKKLVIDTIEYTDFVPIYIELRTLNDASISEQISNLIGIDFEQHSTLIKEFPFAYFFDGVDEIPLDKKDEIIKRIKVFSEEFINSKIVITSRPDQSLLELHSFSRFKIKPLEIHQSYSLLKLYDANSFNIGNSLTLSKKLISEIEQMRDKDSISILEFLTTPLYVSLLFSSYKYKPVIPRRKDLFYSQVFESLFETHDLSKETGYVRRKQSGLDITEFSLLLRRLAFWCVKNNGKIEFTRLELESILIDITSKLKGIEVKPALFVKDLIYAVPLFIKEGALYRWSHKSLMEYFCAEFICTDVKENREMLLLKLFEINSVLVYKNILELCSDIDYSTFRQSVLKKCLNDYLIHMAKIKNELQLNDRDLEIWASISFFSNLSMVLTPYINANLGDFEKNNDEHERLSTFENTFIGFQDYITHITYPLSLRNTVLEILRWRHAEYFYKEKDFYTRPDVEKVSLPEDKIIECNDGLVVNYTNELIPEIISVLLHFRHTLTIPVIKYSSAVKVLKDISDDKSNGIDALLDGF